MPARRFHLPLTRRATQVSITGSMNSNNPTSSTNPAGSVTVNSVEQEKYWRSTFSSRPYAKDFNSYDEVAPAYRYGWESAVKHKGHTFEETESTLKRDWDKVKGKSEATWDKAKAAVKDAWNRVVPGRHD